MPTDEGFTHGGSLGRGPALRELGDLDRVGVIVLGPDGGVVSSNDRARALLQARTAAALAERVRAVCAQMGGMPAAGGGERETVLQVGDLPPLGVSAIPVSGEAGAGCVLLVKESRALAAGAELLCEASRQRVFSALARDWAHDVKGSLHVIRINHALMSRAIERAAGSGATPLGTKSLEAIPREIERLDRSLELMLNTRAVDQQVTVDVGSLCERLVRLVGGRASRQRIEVVFEQEAGDTDVVGFEDQMIGAILNLIVNAFEAMPEPGRLVITAIGGSPVRVRVCDTGAGLQPERLPHLWQPHLVDRPRRTGIGLHVTRSIVEAHGGRIECSANDPRGTCFEISLPAASTGHVGHGARTHR